MTEFFRSKYLVAGCTKPDDATLETFFETAKRQIDPPVTAREFQVRWIGGDAGSTQAILDHIRSGDKTGTVSLPTVMQFTGQPLTQKGDLIVLINFDGTPELVLKISDVETVAYGHISERHTALDGPRVRDLPVWKPLHVRYFDMLLAPQGETCTDDTPITFETFEVMYDRLQAKTGE